MKAKHQFRIRDASPDRQPKNSIIPGEGRLFKELWSTPTTTADSEATHWIKEVEMVDSVDDLKSSSSVRGIRMPDFEVLDATIASAMNRTIHNSQFKRRVSLEEQKSPQKAPFPSWKTDRLLDLRVLPGHWSQRFCREVCRPMHYWSSKRRYSGIRFEVGRNFIINDKDST